MIFLKKFYNKIIPKITAKVLIGAVSQSSYTATSGTPLPSQDELIAFYSGVVTEIDGSTYAKATPGNTDVAQVKGVSVLFDGTGFGTLTDPETGLATSVLLPAGDWDEPIEFRFSTATVAVGYILTGDVAANDELAVHITSSGFVRLYVYVGGVLGTVMVTANAYTDGLPHKVSIDYVSGSLSLTVDSETLSSNVALDGNQLIKVIGAYSSGSTQFTGNLWGLSGPGFKLNMACGTDLVHPTVELSATPGGPNCTWASFASTIYEEHSDGSGFDLNVLGWSERENRFKQSSNFLSSEWPLAFGTAVTENQIISPDGTLTGDLITITGVSADIKQQVDVAEDTKYTITFYVLKGTILALKYSVYDVINTGFILSGIPYVDDTSQTAWAKISFTFTTPSGCSKINFYPNRQSGELGTFYLWSAQMFVTSSASFPIETTSAPIIGRQPAGYQGHTDNLGPIATSMKTGGIPCIRGDSTGEIILGSDIDLPGDFQFNFDVISPLNLSYDPIFGSDNADTYTRSYCVFLKNDGSIHYGFGDGVATWSSQTSALGLVNANEKISLALFRIGTTVGILNTVSNDVLSTFTSSLYPQQGINRFCRNGVDYSNAKLFNLVLLDSDGSATSLWPCEAGEGTILEDTISGNNGILTSFAGDPWSTRDIGRCLMRENGFSIGRTTGDENFPNGTFDTDISGVTNPAPTRSTLSWDSIGERLTMDATAGDGGAPAFKIAVSLTAGNSYTIDYDHTGTTVQVIVAGVTFLTLPATFICASDVTDIQIYGDIGGLVYFDDITAKEYLPGVSVCNTDGLHQDGSTPQFPRNTMDNLYNAPVLHEGGYGPLMQSVALWTALAQVDLTVIPANTVDQTFACVRGMVVYSAAQDPADRTSIAKILGCEYSLTFPFIFPYKLG